MDNNSDFWIPADFWNEIECKTSEIFRMGCAGSVI